MWDTVQITCSLICNFCFIYFSQNGWWRTFWMPENHFRSHIISDQYAALICFHKMAVFVFLMPKNNFLSHILLFFRSIRNLFLSLFHKMAAGGHFRCPKITFHRISRHFRLMRNFNLFFNLFHKNATGGHFGCPKIISITFLVILWDKNENFV